MAREDVGQVDVKEHYAFVAVRRSKMKQLLTLIRGEKIKGIKNIKIIALIFIIAIALIIYSSVAADKESEKQSFQNDDETRLASILSSVEGAGEVETMITKSSGQIVGVLVIADGANNPIVRLRLLSATASALGVDSDTVSVMSRKN